MSMGATRGNPSLIFPLAQTDNSELDELVKATLEKQGRLGEVNKLMEQAELDYENRIKVAEARQELRRLMGMRGEGMKLMQRGFRKWQQVSYRPIGK